MIEAITLDFHNTIAKCDDWFELEVYDLIPAYFEWHRQACGSSPDPELVSRGREKYRELRHSVMETGIEMDAVSSVARVLEDLSVETCESGLAGAVEEVFRPTLDNCEPMPGVVESVRELRAAGMKLAIVSSAAYHSFLLWTLEKFGIEDCFVAVFTSASTGHYKTSSRIYEIALERLQVAPGAVVHVGDSERFDVDPARSLGMRTVLFHPPGLPTNGSAVADMNLTTLEDLGTVLDQRFGLANAL